MSWYAEPLMRLESWPRLRAFERATEYPEATQKAVLQAILEKQAETAFGVEHRFSAIRTAADYRRAVPIRDYEGFRPYVDKIITGKENILTSEPVLRFAATSGTTEKPKLVPITRSYRQQVLDFWLTWCGGVIRDHPGCFSGKFLRLPGSAVEGRTAGGLAFGAMTGMNTENHPWFVRRNYAAPPELSFVADYEARYLLTLRTALMERVTLISILNPSTLLRLADLLATHADSLLRAVSDGSLGVADPDVIAGSPISKADVVAAIRRRVAPDPARADRLRRLASKRGKLLPSDCWPDLKAIGCWLGGSVGIHARRIGDYFGEDVPLRDRGHLASEGRVALPLEDGTPAGILGVHSTFYEFVPEEEMDSASPSVRLAHELELGRQYYVILTGWNGLYRYDLNDIVEVKGFHNRTPIIAFVRKGRDMVSITGEKLHLNQVQASVKAAEALAGLNVLEFRIIPNVEASHYELLVEVSDSVGGNDHLERFLSAFDSNLSKSNLEYAAKRHSRRLGPPRLHLMTTGWASNAAKQDFKTGKREAQYKFRQLVLAWDETSRTHVARVIQPT